MHLSPFFRTYRFMRLLVIGLFILYIILDYQMLHSNNKTFADKFFLPFGSVASQRSSNIVIEENRCNVTNPLALQVLDQVKTDQCRQLIIDAACSIQSHTFIPVSLPNSCPRTDRKNAGRYLGCFADFTSNRLLRGHTLQLPQTNSPQLCRFTCLQFGFQLSGVQYEYECFCGDVLDMDGAKMVSEHFCTRYRCPGDQLESCGGFEAIALYNTGLGEKSVLPVSYVAPAANTPKIKILFLLQLSGRNLRQVRRLIKLIYSPNHFYFVHVDARQQVMYQEMTRLEKLLAPVGNFRVKLDRYSTIWGGASLLQMIFSCIKNVADSDWADKWDLLVNLSESDMPVLPLSDLEAVLSKNKGQNFLVSHGMNTAEFVKRQGLEHVFIECDNRMWRIGERGPFPNGIRIGGGSDWIGLDRSFAYYATLSNETLPSALRKIFETVLLSVENFFHTLALNSHFCNRIVNSNLKHINWKLKQGCKCQYKAIVDWCGCSPNVIMPDDLTELEPENAKKRGYWFARKFDTLLSQATIAQVERQAFYNHPERQPDPNHPSFNRVWINDYSTIDGINLKSKWAESVFRVWQRNRTNAEHCNDCRFDKVLSIHIYKENDSAATQFLTKLQLLCGASYLTIELLIERQRSTQWRLLHNQSVNGFVLQSLEVSSEFDPKEDIFRNYIGLIDTQTNPTLRLKWSMEVVAVLNVSSPAVQVVWSKPLYSSQSHAEEVQPQDSIFGVQHIEMNASGANLNLESGVWRAAVLNGNETVAEVSFPIYPSLDNVDLFDLLTDRFYNVVDSCSGNNKFCDSNFSRCAVSVWSSDFADPKSDISSGFDLERQLLN